MARNTQNKRGSWVEWIVRPQAAPRGGSVQVSRKAGTLGPPRDPLGPAHAGARSAQGLGWGVFVAAPVGADGLARERGELSTEEAAFGWDPPHPARLGDNQNLKVPKGNVKEQPSSNACTCDCQNFKFRGM